MGKYTRRKYYRALREIGMPFIEAQKLAKVYGRDGHFDSHRLPEGFYEELVTYCQCCGPEALRITCESGTYEFPYGYLGSGHSKPFKVSQEPK